MNSRVLFALLASGTLLAGPNVAAQQWGYGRAPDAGACFYEDPHFRGRYFCARSGEDLSYIPNGLNDHIMSLRLLGGARVVVYSGQRFGGSEAWFDYDVADLRYEGWDDRISSVRLRWDWRDSDRETHRDYNRNDGYYEGRPRGTSDVEGRPSDRFPGDERRQSEPGYREGAGAGGRVDATASATAIVTQAYRDLLHRDPDAAGLQQYRDGLLNHGWTDAQVRNSIMQSPEYRNAQRSGYAANAATSRAQAQQIVRSAYLNVLKREPDYPGANGWVDSVINDHWTQQDLERELRNSAEYKAKNQGR